MRNDVSVVGFPYRQTPKVFGDVSVRVRSAVSCAISKVRWSVIQRLSIWSRRSDSGICSTLTLRLAIWLDGVLSFLCLEQPLRWDLERCVKSFNFQERCVNESVGTCDRDYREDEGIVGQARMVCVCALCCCHSGVRLLSHASKADGMALTKSIRIAVRLFFVSRCCHMM